MDTEKIFIGIDDQTIELTGDELNDFLVERKKMQEEASTQQTDQQVKAAARESALGKLAALGLTQEEIDAL